MSPLRRHAKKLLVLAAALATFPVAHGVIVACTAIRPPPIASRAELGSPERHEADGVARVGRSYARTRAGVREVYLEGTPEAVGDHHARLLRERMIANEAELNADFHAGVSFLGRVALMDLGRLRYRHVDRGVPEAWRRELAAEARAFAPDPFEGTMPTYHRLLFLHALYDIALSFESSPLLGCSSFVLGPTMTRDGHTLLARAFDFESADAFDRDKAVFFVRPLGSIPFASVAWPGLVGVLSGMNLEGWPWWSTAARARARRGHPGDLRHARGPREGPRHRRGDRHPAKPGRDGVAHRPSDGRAWPHRRRRARAGVEATVRRDFADPARVGVTNHFEGPLRDDPRDAVVRRTTSTLDRRARLDEVLTELAPGSVDPERAVALLRDHRCAGNASCELGDRRTLDALIATHGIVADTTDKTLWVSAGPHLSGRFVRFDLRAIFAPDHDPSADEEPLTLPEDPILHDGRYEQGRARAGTLKLRGEAPR